MLETLTRSLTGIILILGLSGLYFFPHGLTALFIFLMIWLSCFEMRMISLPSYGLALKIALSAYILLPFFFMILLNYSTNRILLIILFILVFSFDTGSYCIGRLFGKHRMIPTISPQKTWEGFLGGIITSNVSLFAVLHFLGLPYFWAFFPFASGICLLAFAGDIFESYLKRKAVIKDSGGLLPGHGGILDRFDSLLLAIYPFFLAPEAIRTFLGL